MIDIAFKTDEPKTEWHSILNSPKHSSKQDRPEREVIAFSTGFAMFVEPTQRNQDAVYRWMLTYGLPVLIILSTSANIIIARVMYYISQWKFPPCLYVVILSIIDISINTVKLTDRWCQVVFSVQLLNSLSLTSEAVCSTLTISMYFLYHLASLLRSALCIDVYYAFKCPLASNKKEIVCRIEHFVLLFVSVLLIFNSHFLWTYSVIHMNQRQDLAPPGNYCTYMVKWVSPTFRDVVWPTVDIFIGEICPILAVLISSTLIGLRSCKNFYSPSAHTLDRHMIDVDAFVAMRSFMLLYNILSLALILIPGAVTYVYKGMTFQRNHAMKMVTTFSTARSSTRSYLDPSDINTLNLCNHLLLLLYPIIVVASGLLFSEKGFRKEFLFLATNTRRNRQIHFQI